MWPTCGSSVMRRDISKKNAQNTTLDSNANTNANPNPNPYELCPEKNRGGGWKKLVDHTKSHMMKYSPISILYPR